MIFDMVDISAIDIRSVTITSKACKDAYDYWASAYLYGKYFNDKKEDTKNAVFYPTSGNVIRIKDVRFSPPATIVFWSDNTKTVVKAQSGELYDAEKGLLACIVKRITGNTGAYNEILKKWTKEDK